MNSLLQYAVVSVLIAILAFLIAIWRELHLLRTNKERLTPTLKQLFGWRQQEPRQHRSRV